MSDYVFKRDQKVEPVPSQQGGNFVYGGDSNSIPTKGDGKFISRAMGQVKPLVILGEGYDWFYSEWFGDEGWFHGSSAQIGEYIFGKLGSIVPEIFVDGNFVIEPQSSIKPPSLSGSFEFGKPL